MGIGLTTKELTSIRNDIEDLLPDTGYVLENTGTSDSMGHKPQIWGIVAGGTTAYRIDPEIIGPLQAKERIGGAGIMPFHTFILTLPHDTTILTENRFKDAGDIEYNITSIDGNKSWKGSVRCFVERI